MRIRQGVAGRANMLRRAGARHYNIDMTERREGQGTRAIVEIARIARAVARAKTPGTEGHNIGQETKDV